MLTSAYGIGLAFVGGLLAFLLLLSTVYGYLRARFELPAATPVTPAAVWGQLRRRLGRMVLVVALLGAGYFALSVGYLAVVGLLVGRGGGPGAAIGSLLLGGGGMLVLVTYLAVVLTLYFPVLWLEDVSIAKALGRCFQLIRGHWWATFGLVIVVSFIQGTLSVVFMIPFYASMMGKMLQVKGLDSDVFGLVGTTFYSVGVLFAYTLLLLAAAFQYFNLAEQREGHGLRLLVAGLGQGAPAAAASHHYQPSEEGEY